MRFTLQSVAALCTLWLLAVDCRRLVQVVMTADNQWTCWLNGVPTTGPLDSATLGYGWQQPKVISQWVDDGQFLFACKVQDYGVVGGFIASVFVDGVLEYETNPGNGWTALTTGATPAAGWNTNLAFSDAAWTPVTSTCPIYPAWASVTSAVKVNGSTAAWLWGPTCQTTNNIVLYRLLANTNDGKRNLAVSLYADDAVLFYGPGLTITGSGWYLQYSNKSRVAPGTYVIAAQVWNGGGIGGLIAALTIDGCPALTTDTTALTNWIFTKTQPAAGWNTDVNFSTTGWSNITAACPFYDNWGGEDVTLQNSGPNPSWIWGQSCAVFAGTIWFRSILTVPDLRMPLTFVVAVDSPFFATIDTQVFDQTSMTYNSRLQAWTFTQLVFPGERVIALRLSPTSSFLPSNGFIGAVYLSGRLIATTGSNRQWTTTFNAPNADAAWYTDIYPTSPSSGWQSVFGVMPLGKAGWNTVETSIRANGVDAKWISGPVGDPLTQDAWFRLVVNAQSTTPSIVYPVKTVTNTVTATVTAVKTYCPST